jgi:hypothetical protein
LGKSGRKIGIKWVIIGQNGFDFTLFPVGLCACLSPSEPFGHKKSTALCSKIALKYEINFWETLPF